MRSESFTFRHFRLIWMRSGRGNTYISSGILLPSKVTHLVIKRPLHFNFRPGDYVFVNIPAIAKYEWHPFTLSSAPEQEGNYDSSITCAKSNKIYRKCILDYMGLHIRGVGEWTQRLYNYFKKQEERLHNGEVPAYIPGSSKQVTNDFVKKPSATPQKDFLSQNLARINHNPMLKSSSDNGLTDRMKSDADPAQNGNDFPVRPPRHNAGTSKLAIENYSPPLSNPPRLSRQTSESTTIRKIQATLQRTFSRKGSAETNDIANETIVEDRLDEEKAIPQRKLTPELRLNMSLSKKAPLEKSLSMPDIENRLKRRDRQMA